MPCARKAALIENIVSWAPTGQKVTRDKKSGDVGEISARCHDPMTDLADLELGRRARRLRVDTLVRLRWLAILGQSGAVLTIEYGLGFELPLGLCFIAIALSAWLNIALRLRFSLNHRLDEGPASILLAYDVLQLSVLLYLTGGLENPFSLLFLAPVMISAVSLSGLRTLMLGALIVICATVLAFWHLPLPWYRGQEFQLPILYIAGIWVAIVLGSGFIWVYASRVAEEARLLSDALAATELVLAREQHLTQLDGLAAAAAHELGTPLATITLVVKDLESHGPPDGNFREDVQLLSQEVRRCRTILSKLASLGDERGGMMETLGLGQLIEEVVEPQRNFGVEVAVLKSGEGPEPVTARNPGMLYGLGNLVENAIDFARTEVRIEAEWSSTSVMVRIRDDGPGFSPDILAHLGEPYVTTRGPARRAKSEEGGLGLGLFIAKTLLERSGAVVTPRNAAPPGQGACIEIRWPKAAFERPRPQTTAPSSALALPA